MAAASVEAMKGVRQRQAPAAARVQAGQRRSEQADLEEEPRGEGRGGAWWSRVWLSLTLLAIVAGLVLPTERYLNPQYGYGYALGIVGGLMMLALLVYPLRKRKRSLAFLGSIPAWFRIHMVFGVIGPLAILYHANFGLGATNSNVALICMLIVGSSGLIGRYLYARVHYGLYGRRASLNELVRDAERLREHSGALRVLPGLMDEIAMAERHIGAPSLLFVRPFLAAWRQRSELRRLRRLIEHSIGIAATRSRVIAWQRERLNRAAQQYIEARLVAVRRVAEFEASERLFAAWHIVHMPLFITMVVVGIVHVFAVHMY